jgi:hypothetical protein
VFANAQLIYTHIKPYFHLQVQANVSHFVYN